MEAVGLVLLTVVITIFLAFFFDQDPMGWDQRRKDNKK